MKNKCLKYLSVSIVLALVFCSVILAVACLYQRPPSTHEATPKELDFKTTVSDVEADAISSAQTKELDFKTTVSDVEADAISSAQTNAQQLYQQILPVKGDKKAMAEVLVYLKSLPIVEDAGISEAESSIWIRYTNGIEGGILTNPPGTK